MSNRFWMICTGWNPNCCRLLSWMQKALGIENDVSQNPDVNGLDKCPKDIAIAPFVKPLTLAPWKRSALGSYYIVELTTHNLLGDRVFKSGIMRYPSWARAMAMEKQRLPALHVLTLLHHPHRIFVRLATPAILPPTPSRSGFARQGWSLD